MIKTQIIYFIILLSLSYSLNLSAQNKQYRDSPTVIIFSKSTIPKEVTEKKRKKHGEENLIKIAPLGIVSGTFPIYYERVIAKGVSLQGGIGFTNRNYYREVGFISSDAMNFNNSGSLSTSNDLADPLYHFDNRSASFGFMYAIQSRYYFDFEDDGLDCFFMGIGYQNCRYNFEHLGIVGAEQGMYNHTYYGSTKKSEHETLSDLFAILGWQNLYERVSLESTIEFGIRKAAGTKYVAFASSDGAGGYVVLDQNQFKNYDQTKLYFNIGFKVGIHF